MRCAALRRVAKLAARAYAKGLVGSAELQSLVMQTPDSLRCATTDARMNLLRKRPCRNASMSSLAYMSNLRAVAVGQA